MGFYLPEEIETADVLIELQNSVHEAWPIPDAGPGQAGVRWPVRCRSCVSAAVHSQIDARVIPEGIELGRLLLAAKHILSVSYITGMKTTLFAAILAAACAAGILGTTPAQAPKDDPPYVLPEAMVKRTQPIFDGKTLDGWNQFPAESWIVKDGAMASTGNGRGVLYTKEDYNKYRLFFTMRHVSVSPIIKRASSSFARGPKQRKSRSMLWRASSSSAFSHNGGHGTIGLASTKPAKASPRTSTKSSTPKNGVKSR